MENNVNTDLIRDHVDSFILRFLAAGDSYGYDIHKAISSATDGVYEIKQPTLYSCLKRLEKQGFINSYDGETSNGAQRKYYSITDKGRTFVEDDIKQWEFSRTLLNRLLSDKEFDLTNAPRPFDPSELRPRTKRGVGVTNAAQEEVSVDSAEETQDQDAETPNEPLAVSDSPVLEDDGTPEPDMEPVKPIQNAIFGTHVEGTQIDLESYVAAQAEEPAQEGILQDFLQEKLSQNDDYLTPLNDLFNTPVPPSISVQQEEAPKEEANHSAFNYGELKERAQAEGYRLHPYSKAASTSYYSMNFIFSSRLKRDSFLLLYLFMLVELLVAGFAFDRYANLGFVFYIVTGCILLVFPIFGVIMYLIKPDKRVRAEFDLKTALSGMIMLTINLVIVSMLFAFFLFKADLGSPKTMVRPLLYPFLLFVDLPVYTLIYAVLYNTKRYHLK